MHVIHAFAAAINGENLNSEGKKKKTYLFLCRLWAFYSKQQTAIVAFFASFIFCTVVMEQCPCVAARIFVLPEFPLGLEVWGPWDLHSQETEDPFSFLRVPTLLKFLRVCVCV